MSTTEKTSATCDFCGADAVPPIYQPLGTRRGMEVWVCHVCGLTQSHSTAVPEGKVRTLSTDADWGNVRHGKGVRFDALRQIMEKHVDWKTVSQVIDVGANRGDFVLWMHGMQANAIIWAVEPDVSVTDRYRDVSGIDIRLDRLEHLDLPDDTFDLVFCAHTLEHATSASAMLRQIHASIRQGGWLMLEVPNLEAISLPDIVEEYFIDKHHFHFDRETLVDFIKQSGYSIVSGSSDTDPLNLTLLLRREGDSSVYSPINGSFRAGRNTCWIQDYRPRLEANRKLLRRIVEEKLRPLATRQKVAYWGAGRIFDSLVKYGGLLPSDVYCLVDRFLFDIVKETHGVPIDKPERLRLVEPHVIVVLGNSGEQAMAKQAYDLGVRHVIKFSELMEQVRDVPMLQR